MSKMNQQDYNDYKDLIKQGYSQRKAAVILDIPRTTIQHYLKRYAELQNEKLKQSIHRYQNTEHGESFDEFDFFEGEPKKPPFAEACNNVANAIGNIGKTMSGESNERYLELPNTEHVENKPKLLFYDIETSLAKSYHFQQWKVNLSQKQKIQESHLLSHAWAWGEGEVTGSILTREEMLSHDPERLVLECWSLLDNCDILVAHNGKRFDVKKVNGYFLQYGMPPPSPYRVIDTLLIAKQKFALPFNSLAYLAEFLDVEQKVDTGGVDLWIQCDQGNQEALDKMNEYCMGDIVTLRGVYSRLIGWSNDGVNLALYSDHGASCPHCSNDDVSVIQGKYSHTVARKYQAYRCNGCGAVLRSSRKEGNSNSLVRVV